MQRAMAAPDTMISLEHVQDEDAFKHEKAYEVYVPMEPCHPKSNIDFVAFDNIKVRDARERGLENFSIGSNGFQFLRHNFDDGLTMEVIQGPEGAEAVRRYLEALHVVLRETLGAEGVILYDWRVRTTSSSEGFPRPAKRTLELPPARWVHADESARCGRRIVIEHLAEDERAALEGGRGRFRIMNIWRALVPVVRERPLALCDWRSVQSEDWELCDQIHHDRVDEAMYLKRREGHEWWWLSNQRADELSLFVVWDSLQYEKGGQASTPHGAFELPGTQGKYGRQSIEVRSIIWTKE